MVNASAKALAAKLMTPEGVQEELASVYQELSLEPTRDQCTALINRKHILMSFSDLQEKALEARSIEELSAKLSELEARLESSDDANTSFTSAPNIPRRDSPKSH